MRNLFGSNGVVARRAPRFVIAVLPILLAACATTASGETASYHPASGTYFTVSVRNGDSVSEIAARYHVEQDDIVAINDLHDQDEIRPDMKLMVPAYGGGRAPVTHDAPPPVRTASNHPIPKPVPRPGDKLAPRPAQKVAEAPADKSDGSFLQTAYETITGTSSEAAASTNGKFLWPVSGQVLSAYGSTATGERNDGINIAASEGAPVRAAAAGVVTYAGNELKGYGNLVLIRHDNGYVTAYAHNDRLAVNRGDRVNAGQVIGYAGATGDVSTPQVHFEIRKGTHAVDPRPLLVMASN
jgi:murein DD-endopeptidase MepM/ murein hydrolase activator NlpD